ncbi:MAG TPA: type II secretion system F family protein [Microthrixaceae bacterium]|nr:type II secretion system F family protein [Microthrixaceae bacterium]
MRRSSKARRVGLLAVIFALFLMTLPVAAAGAADGDKAKAKGQASSELAVGSVDATGDYTVIEGWLTGASVDDIKVKVDGRSVTPASAELNTKSGRSTDVVAVIDNSGLLGNGTVQLAKSALEPLMPGAGVTDSLGVVSTGEVATLEQGLTKSPSQLKAAMISIRPIGESHTWAGLTRAADMLSDRGANSDGTIVLFTAAPSTQADGGASAAISALRRAGVDLQIVTIPSGVDVGTLNEMVADVGGTITSVTSDEDLDTAFKEVAATINGRFQLKIPRMDGHGTLTPLTLKAGDSTVEASFVPGALRVGSTALSPAVDPSGGLSGFLAHPITKWLIVLLGVVAAVLLFWAIISLVMPDDTNLVKRLEVYEDPYGEKPEEFAEHDDAHATVPIIRRAVELTGDIADKRGATDKLEMKLEQANVPLRAAEVMFFLVSSAVLGFLLTLALTRNPIMAIVVGAVAIVVPRTWLSIRVSRRQKAFVNQLPDMLTLLSGTLRAGYSIGQGFESVSTEIEEPMGRELRRVVTETRLGRSLEESLESVATRMESDDFAWAVMAIRIQREVGGNLAELLMTVADTMTQRERLRRDVSTLTAEGRMSAIIIGFLPPALALVMYVMNPEYIKELFSPGLGYGLVIAALVMMGIGFAWMKKTVTIEV